MSSEIDVVCGFCKAIFKVKRHEAKRQFCSKRCQCEVRKKRIQLICEYCGQQFEAQPNQVKNGRRFCSKKCRYSGLVTRIANPAIFNCGWCGKPISMTRGKFNSQAKNHFCSKECETNWRCNGGMPGGQDHPEYNSITVHCANCDKELIRQPYRANAYKSQFCNHKCFGEWRSKNVAGDNHPGWKGGTIDYYGPNWRQQSRAARKRDGYKCQHCGISQKQNKRQLDVHHIIPFRAFNYIPGKNDFYLKANDLTNLITLCRACHALAERGSIYIQPTLL